MKSIAGKGVNHITLKEYNGTTSHTYQKRSFKGVLNNGKHVGIREFKCQGKYFEENLCFIYLFISVWVNTVPVSILYNTLKLIFHSKTKDH